MIVDLPDTTTTELSKRLVKIRSEVGAMALSRVLTLVVVVDEGPVCDVRGVGQQVGGVEAPQHRVEEDAVADGVHHSVARHQLTGRIQADIEIPVGDFLDQIAEHLRRRKQRRQRRPVGRGHFPVDLGVRLGDGRGGHGRRARHRAQTRLFQKRATLHDEGSPVCWNNWPVLLPSFSILHCASPRRTENGADTKPPAPAVT